MPLSSSGSMASMMRVTTCPNESSPTLAIRRTGTPNLCRARPVLDTGPPVERVAAPASSKWPGRKLALKVPGSMALTSGMMSRQMCPATMARRGGIMMLQT